MDFEFRIVSKIKDSSGIVYIPVTHSMLDVQLTMISLVQCVYFSVSRYKPKKLWSS